MPRDQPSRRSQPRRRPRAAAAGRPRARFGVAPPPSPGRPGRRERKEQDAGPETKPQGRSIGGAQDQTVRRPERQKAARPCPLATFSTSLLRTPRRSPDRPPSSGRRPARCPPRPSGNGSGWAWSRIVPAPSPSYRALCCWRYRPWPRESAWRPEDSEREGPSGLRLGPPHSDALRRSRCERIPGPLAPASDKNAPRENEPPVSRHTGSSYQYFLLCPVGRPPRIAYTLFSNAAVGGHKHSTWGGGIRHVSIRTQTQTSQLMGVKK